MWYKISRTHRAKKESWFLPLWKSRSHNEVPKLLNKTRMFCKRWHILVFYSYSEWSTCEYSSTGKLWNLLGNENEKRIRFIHLRMFKQCTHKMDSFSIPNLHTETDHIPNDLKISYPIEFWLSQGKFIRNFIEHFIANYDFMKLISLHMSVFILKCYTL